MANEFKVKKGLIIQGSGSTGDTTILDVQGNQGQLFSITDSLEGTLFSVSDISGIPILDVNSNEVVKIGTFGNEGIIVHGSNVTSSGAISASLGFVGASLDINGNADISGNITTATWAGAIIPEAKLENQSGTNTGDTSITDSTSTTSSTTRASATAAKAAYDRGSTGITNAASAATTANDALPKAGGTLTGDLTIDKNTPRLDFMSNQSGTNVGGRIELSENGNLWVNAQGGKDLWLNWYSPNAQSSNADLAVGDGDSGSAILFVDGSARKVGILKTTPGEALEVVGNISASGAIDGASLDINGNADISGNITTATWAGATIAANKIATLNQDTTGLAAQATNLNASDDRDVAPEDLGFSDDLRIFFAEKAGIEGNSIANDYQDLLILNSYNDASGGNMNALAFDKSTHRMLHYNATYNATNWGTAKQIAYIDSTLTTAAQTNITSLGILTNINTSGNITASGNISSSGTGYFEKISIDEVSPNSKLHVGNATGFSGKALTLENSPSGRFQAFGFDGSNSFYTAYAPTFIIGYGESTGAKPTVETIKIKQAGTVEFLSDITVGNHITASGNISSSGTITANSFVGTFTGGVTGNATGLTGTPDIIVGSLTATSITSSIVTSSIIYTEGSNIFGDTISDTHLFNGHVTASGGISSSGTIIANKIGIGTASPQHELHVEGVARVRGELMVGSSGATNTPSATLHIKDTGTDSKLRIEDADNDNTYFDFLVDEGNGLYINEASDTRLSIKEGGNVGIGTTSPGEKLTVAGAISSSGDIKSEGHIIVASNNANADRHLEIKNTTKSTFISTTPAGNNAQTIIRGGNYTHALYLKDSYNSVGQNAADLYYARLNGGYSHESKLTLFTSQSVGGLSAGATTIIGTATSSLPGKLTVTGRVGIGTTSPDELFDVAGTARFETGIAEGTIYVGNNIQHWGDGGTGVYFDTDEVQIQTDGGKERLKISNTSISASSNVYITGSTINPLHVRNNDAAGANGYSLIKVENGTGTAEFGTVSNYARIRTNGTEIFAGTYGATYFYNNGKTSLTLNSNGVGAGTDAPAAKLHIAGNVWASGSTTTGAGHITASGNISASGAINGASINLADSKKLQLGTSQDLQIYHDPGVGSIISDGGPGDLFIDTNQAVRFRKTGTNEVLALMTPDGSVELYHNNVKKIETTSAGVEVVGEVQGDTLNIDGNADISGNITTATWAGAIIPEAKLENQSGTNTGDNAANTTYGNVTNESKATMFTSPTFTGNVTASGNISSSEDLTVKDITTSGTISSTGTITAANTFIADGVDATNNDPGSDNLRVSGYGLIGNRDQIYFTNRGNKIVFGVGSTHNGANKLIIAASTSTFSTSIRAGADSTYDIGTSATRFKDIYADQFVGALTGNATGLTGTPDIIVGSLTATSITSSIVTSSIIYTEGSNIFGDTISDTHLFNGHITASGNISASGTGTHTFGGNVKIDNPSTVGQLYIDSAATSDVVINLSNNDVQKSKIGWDHSESALAFVVGTGAFSAAGMVLDSTGVGIGTTSPSAKLHLIGNIIAEQPTNTNAEIKLNPNSSALGTSYAWNLVAGNSANSYGFDIKQGTTSILRINNSAGGNNNVGIGTGTTSPTEKLTVVGDISASGDINVNNNSQFKGKHTNGTEYGLLTLTSGNVVKVGAYDYQSASTVFGGGDNAQFLIGSSEVMRLRSTGLEVTGHITASGNISASGEVIADVFRGESQINFQFGSSTWDAMTVSANGKLELASGGANDRAHLLLHADHGSSPRSSVIEFENEAQGSTFIFTDGDKNLKLHTSDPGLDQTAGSKVLLENSNISRIT